MCRLSWNLEASTSWNLLGLSRSVMGLLFSLLYVHLLMNNSTVALGKTQIPTTITLTRVVRSNTKLTWPTYYWWPHGCLYTDQNLSKSSRVEGFLQQVTGTKNSNLNCLLVAKGHDIRPLFTPSQTQGAFPRFQNKDSTPKNCRSVISDSVTAVRRLAVPDVSKDFTAFIFGGQVVQVPDPERCITVFRNVGKCNFPAGFF